MTALASSPLRVSGWNGWGDGPLSLVLREAFGPHIVPSPPQRFPATDRMFERLDENDLARTLEVLRDRLDPETFHDLTESLPSYDPKHYRRELLRYGTHLVPEIVGARTGLSAANPPPEVHCMVRQECFIGDQYSSDLVVEELERCHMPVLTGGRYLDFGCSSGAAVRYLQAAYPEAQWYGCDPVDESVAWASEHLPSVRFAVSPQWPPLPYPNASFDGIYAISIWSHFSERTALIWFDEMARLLKPGGALVFTTHGLVTLEYALRNGWRTPQGVLEIAADLRAGRFRFEEVYLRNNQVQAELDTISDWGDAFMPVSWVTSRLLDLWDLVSFQPGRNQENQDLYLLRRKAGPWLGKWARRPDNMNRTPSLSGHSGPIRLAEIQADLPPPEFQTSGQVADQGAATAPAEETQPLIALQLPRFVTKTPANQNCVDLFEGRWVCALPVPGLRSGGMALFSPEDARPQAAAEVFGSLEGFRILELGPLEGAHSYQLERLGAGSILGIDASPEFYLKGLITKEVLDLKARFLLGDFNLFLAETDKRFDLVFACGVLDHMLDPLETLHLISRVTPRVFLWTHYVAKTMGVVSQVERHGYRCDYHEIGYDDQDPGRGLSGIASSASRLRRDDILGALRGYGFDRVVIIADEPNHQGGPAVTLAAERLGA
jgi:SAM-dependent methyltransferase